MAETFPTELPPKYYLDNFRQVLAFVEDFYGKLLSHEEQEFIASFRKLPENSQCLYVRMHNRKGVFFRPQKFQYAEIEHLEQQVKTLLKRKWVVMLQLQTVQEAYETLAVFTRPELLQIAQAAGAESIRSLKKDELAATLIELLSLPQLTEALLAADQVIRMQKEETAAFLMFLYFGGSYGSMTEFVVRDMGHVRFEAYAEDQFVARFQTRKEATDAFWALRLYQTYKEVSALLPPAEVYEWLMEYRQVIAQLDETARPRIEKLLTRFARDLERSGLTTQAIKVYEQAKAHPARERLIRLFQKEGKEEEALALCQQIEEAPLNAEELFFALDFKAKIQKKTFRKSVTVFLKEAESLEISAQFEHRVEAGVLAHYLENGYQGCFSENYLWRSLFGLLFWEVIYDPQYAAIHHPFQRAPSDLFGPDFFAVRLSALQTQLALLHRTNEAMNYMESIWQVKEGISNPFVGWHPETLFHIEKMLHHITAPQLKTVMLEMARDLKNNLTGFPDLFVWNQAEYAFLEVKSPNDQLSAQQLYWIRFLQKAGISARPIKVVWC